MAENIIQILIYFHVALGAIALFSGAISLIVTKGNRLHKKAGVVFYYTMLGSALLSLNLCAA